MPSRFLRQQCQRFLAACALFPLLSCTVAIAAEGAPSPIRWQIVETANFRLLCYGQHPVSSRTAERCEQLRTELAAQWLADRPDAEWSPKCDLVLHPSDASYFREVGPGGRSTLASALVDRREGRIALRRVDIRATRDDWENSALAHELAHVILADRFASEPIPRWVDEGAAILADSPAKRQRHVRDVRRAVGAGAHFRLAELLALSDYPPQGRWNTFYDQSAALVEYLVDQQGPSRFAAFVEISRKHGYDHATETVYGCGLFELERRWLRSLDSAQEARIGGDRNSSRPELAAALGSSEDS